MKLKTLAPILFSNRNLVVLATVYDLNKGKELLINVIVEQAIEQYGNREVYRTYPEKGIQIIEIN